MGKLMVEMTEDYFQFATIIDNRLPISTKNIGFSIYPHRAISGDKLNEVKAILPDFNFKVA